MAIKEVKEGNDIIIFNDKTFKTADVIFFEDYCLGVVKSYYRVDFEGITKDSMLNLTEAKKLARKLVK